jgi:hypothetical protein
MTLQFGASLTVVNDAPKEHLQYRHHSGRASFDDCNMFLDFYCKSQILLNQNPLRKCFTVKDFRCRF